MSTDEQPLRSLQLIWGEGQSGTRGPKRRLELADIAAAAIKLADAEGLEALSMRRVATELGVGTMSLYRYVPAKSDLIAVMLDTVSAESTLVHKLRGSWRRKLERAANDTRAMYMRHPWTLEVPLTRWMMGPNESRRYDSILRSLDGIGLTDQEILATTVMVDGYIRGVTSFVVEEAQAQRRSGMSDEQWWGAQAPLLERVLDHKRFPLLARFAQSGVFMDDFDSWDFGLQRILDGIADLVQQRTSVG